MDGPGLVQGPHVLEWSKWHDGLYQADAVPFCCWGNSSISSRPTEHEVVPLKGSGVCTEEQCFRDVTRPLCALNLRPGGGQVPHTAPATRPVQDVVSATLCGRRNRNLAELSDSESEGNGLSLSPVLWFHVVFCARYTPHATWKCPLGPGFAASEIGGLTRADRGSSTAAGRFEPDLAWAGARGPTPPT